MIKAVLDLPEQPVLFLRHEALAYEKMGRMERAELIRATIRKELS